MANGAIEAPPCIYGNASSSVKIALFGDSHAAQWFPALHQLARKHGWRLEVLAKQGCPTADIHILRTALEGECRRWRTKVAERLAGEKPNLIVMSSYRYRPGSSDVGLDADEVWRRGFDETLAALRPTAAQVLVLGDTPTPAADVPTCVASHLRSVDRCIRDRAEAVRMARLVVEQETAAKYQAVFASTSDWICTPTKCPVILGDVLLYRDDNHMTTVASTLLAPYLEATMVPLL